MNRHVSLPSAALLLAAGLSAGGCDQPTKPTVSTASASATAAPTSATPPKPAGMPHLLVDTLGPYIGSERVDLALPDGAEKLERLVKALPIEGKTVTVVADKRAKTPHVTAVVTALGKAGAPRVLVKTDGRAELPKELTLTPSDRVADLPACTVATMISKDLATVVWPSKGGTGKRHAKGFAGPDLSHTGEQLKKDLAACESSFALVSGDDSITWEMTYNLAGTVFASDENKKIETLVLLAEPPVAGRAVELGAKR